MPTTNETPPRTIRIPDKLWRAARARSEERGETVTDVILRALTHPTTPPKTRPTREPANGNTPRRAVRVPDKLWTKAIIGANERGETVTDVVTRALQRYVRS